MFKPLSLADETGARLLSQLFCVQFFQIVEEPVDVRDQLLLLNRPILDGWAVSFLENSVVFLHMTD